MKQRIFGIALAILSTLISAPAALAQEEVEYYDARLEGYPQGVMLDLESTALTWLLFVFLSVVCVAVTFKNARRTHLD